MNPAPLKALHLRTSRVGLVESTETRPQFPGGPARNLVSVRFGAELVELDATELLLDGSFVRGKRVSL